MWEQRITRLESVEDLDKLPAYGVMFFLKNMGEFRVPFVLLTLNGVISSVLRFATVYLLSRVVSDAAKLSRDDIFSFYLPAWLGAMALSELLDFFTRKYSEPLPAVYAEYTALRFYLTLLNISSHRLSNFSKEKLMSLVQRYVANVQAFLNDWKWSLIRMATRGLIVLIILAIQSWVVLALNLVYIAFFLLVALPVSARFSAYARRYSEQRIETQAVTTSMTLNLNTVRRLGIRGFYARIYRDLLGRNWRCLEEVQAFHAKRWLLQLNLFNLLYIGTLVFAVYQIKEGLLPLGYLVLLKWAFDELWQLLVYMIEYYVSLVQQKQDADLIRREFKTILAEAAVAPEDLFDEEWQEIELRGVTADFTPPDAPEKLIHIRVPHLRVQRGDKIGIIGPSGAGKTTIFNMLLNLVPYSGSYEIDGRGMRSKEIAARQLTTITNHDPLFKLSLRDNILLGREISPELLDRVLRGTRVLEFAPDLEACVGDPGFHLSAGQEQRIRLARGLLQESACYLLDEPFNGLDGDTKRAIIAFLKGYLHGVTVILVTHNPDELDLVEKVYAFDNGVLVVGRHRAVPVRD